MGELMCIIINGRIYPGSYSIEWKSNYLKPGIYYLIISCNRFTKNFRVLKL